MQGFHSVLFLVMAESGHPEMESHLFTCDACYGPEWAVTGETALHLEALQLYGSRTVTAGKEMKLKCDSHVTAHFHLIRNQF